MQLIEQLSIFSENILLQRVLVILFYGLLTKAADLFIDRILKKLTAKTPVSFDDQFISFIHAPACWTIFCVGLLHAFALEPLLSAPWDKSLPAIARTALIIIWTVAFFRLSNRVAVKSMSLVVARGKIGKDMYNLLLNIVRVVLVCVGVIWILSAWNVDLTPMFASAGIVGIAVALAAKDTLANFFGGISIFADRSFKVGDYIIIDNTDRGAVVEIGIRSTRIKTRDDVLITIPNSILANAKIINESAPEPRFRIRVPVGVAYGSDLDHVEAVLMRVAKDNPAVVKDPEPRVRVRAFGASSVDFELLCWIESPVFKGFQIHTILKTIYKAFETEQITIPFPQRDVHLFHDGEGPRDGNDLPGKSVG